MTALITLSSDLLYVIITIAVIPTGFIIMKKADAEYDELPQNTYSY